MSSDCCQAKSCYFRKYVTGRSVFVLNIYSIQIKSIFPLISEENAVCCVNFVPLACTPAVNLHRFVGCAVREFTFLARKPGCGALHITTDACWGRCETWEKPVLDPPFVDTYQRVCTYNRSRVVTVSLPGCLPDVDPAYSYPVALRCDCSVCVTSTTECITSV
uniref:Glycoprotein hormone beta-5 n=1 Tax=Takifugu rubripes TaxID=31033 RepID=H2SP25_TAKRU